jgi:hypothetical protein
MLTMGKLEGKVAIITGAGSDESKYVTGLEFTVDAGNTIR